MATDRRQFLKNLAPNDPLPVGDQRYVDCSAVRGTDMLQAELADTIRNSNGHASCQLISGHRGCGKTTELFRVQDALMKPKDESPKFFVVYIEADQYLSLNDVQAADVLLSVVTGIWEQVHENTDLRLDKLPVLTDFFGAIARLFGSTNLELTLGIAKVKTDLKRNPTNRQLLRDHIRERTSNLHEAVNELVEAVRNGLSAKGYQGFVTIFDNLDRMVRRQLDNQKGPTRTSSTSTIGIPSPP